MQHFDPGAAWPWLTLAALGVRLVIHPVSALLAATRAVADVYAAIARSGRAGEAPRWAWDDLTTLLGLDDQLLLEERYAEEVTVR